MLSKRSGAAASSLISRCLKAPARVLHRVCDLYVSGITSCGTKMSYGGAVGLGQQAASMLPRSFSVQSGRSSVSGDEDFRDLVMAAKGTSSVPPPPPQPAVVPRSRTVAIGRIDEDKPCVFEEDLVRGSDYLFPRSRSYAVTAAAKGRRIGSVVAVVRAEASGRKRASHLKIPFAFSVTLRWSTPPAAPSKLSHSRVYPVIATFSRSFKTDVLSLSTESEKRDTSFRDNKTFIRFDGDLFSFLLALTRGLGKLEMHSTVVRLLPVDAGWRGKNEMKRFNISRGRGPVLVVRASVASKSLECQKTNVKYPGKEVHIGVLGASGYTGAEVTSLSHPGLSLGELLHLWIVRLLANHPHFGITLMTADRKAGQSFGSVFPHLITQDLPNMVAVKDADFSNVDAVFCCLPHGTTQDIIKGLPRDLKIVDLSADFRLRNINEYEEWYGLPHKAPELQKEAIYGLTEVSRDEIQNALLVANPGCYPTSIQLPLIPLIKAHLIETRNIIIDAKSGVSGAGLNGLYLLICRGAKEANLYTEIAEGLHSYGITKHRHVPEIEQGLTDASNSRVTVSFTPHLIPMSRGMQSTIYIEMAPGVNASDLYDLLKSTYQEEEFVKLLDKGRVPETRHVRGSNYCLMNVFEDRIPGRAIIISVIDNLVKGASGQALQNLNLMMGLPENTGLQHLPLFP
ncbi:hypothetical protein ZIOFF_004122 [Zingiber officinale]|uniref:Probable N-acetyl-gamma-glutamyl-phosphate reductase, chloroplastic n=1 Tax=Zingiber officinale TaxID=94328 RepID=A0A8J5INS3_ZINOF|nr:hypothetical protein ZIOFF_004122 [Zingiber officinale]